MLTSVTLKNLAGLLHLSTEHKGARRVWQEQGAHSQNDSRDSSQSQGQSPSPVSPDCTIVDAGCSQDTEDAEALEQQVEGTPPPRGGNL